MENPLNRGYVSLNGKSYPCSFVSGAGTLINPHMGLRLYKCDLILLYGAPNIMTCMFLCGKHTNPFGSELLASQRLQTWVNITPPCKWCPPTNPNCVVVLFPCFSLHIGALLEFPMIHCSVYVHPPSKRKVLFHNWFYNITCVDLVRKEGSMGSPSNAGFALLQRRFLIFPRLQESPLCSNILCVSSHLGVHLGRHRESGPLLGRVTPKTLPLSVATAMLFPSRRLGLGIVRLALLRGFRLQPSISINNWAEIPAF